MLEEENYSHREQHVSRHRGLKQHGTIAMTEELRGIFFLCVFNEYPQMGRGKDRGYLT